MADLGGCVCIFDLDGTLVDSAPDLTAALNRALLREGLRTIDEDQVRGLVGEGAMALLRRGFAMQDRGFPEGGEAERLVQDYVDDYALHICERSAAFPGVEACLDQLEALGATLAVCTNKNAALSEPLLKQVGLWHWFAEVISADTLAERKPSPLPLHTILERTHCHRGVMMGDTITDLKAARAAGLPCFIATFGYGVSDPQMADAPQFSSFEELPPRIVQWFSQPDQA